MAYIKKKKQFTFLGFEISKNHCRFAEMYYLYNLPMYLSCDFSLHIPNK